MTSNIIQDVPQLISNLGSSFVFKRALVMSGPIILFILSETGKVGVEVNRDNQVGNSLQ